ncbi:MAG: 30S ribosomal protein S16 [Saprospiraceae bacterium]|nr:30S ribosomal protein S16 [Saprospiraceae bacterium]MBK8081934.1 30S ribosomal protein S16 [Saprospiraceae bacterium]MBK8854609.1 30S ribosomal protein S16 [Saprospiraceae bacterium]MBP6694870.1 30S ribosomal protein S16 [Saprospiraceae bacterium]
MPVKIRLSRKGRSKAPFYHIVVADSRASRDGKFIEKIGTYNPMTKPASIEIDRDAAYDWLEKGAQPTDTVRAILRFKGVYFKKHLMRGLKKGALTQEQVDTMLATWIEAKESKIQSRVDQNKADIEAFRKAVSGEAKKAKVAVADESTRETAEAIFHAGEDAVAETTETLEEVASDVITSNEETPEEVVAETTESVEEVAETVEEVAAETVEEVAAETVEEATAEVTEAVSEESPETEAETPSEEEGEEA